MARVKTRHIWSQAEEHLKAIDSQWSLRIGRVGHCSLVPMEDHFGTLVRSIISQQISTQAARTIGSRLSLLTGEPYHPERILALEEEELRGVGLSRAKATYVRNLAEAVSCGLLDLKALAGQADADLITQLTAVKGIGRWTAEMFLIFALNRPDVLPVGDLGIRAGIQGHFELKDIPDPAKCQELTEPWRPFRTVASWYLWRDADRLKLKTTTSRT